MSHDRGVEVGVAGVGCVVSHEYEVPVGTDGDGGMVGSGT